LSEIVQTHKSTASSTRPRRGRNESEAARENRLQWQRDYSALTYIQRREMGAIPPVAHESRRRRAMLELEFFWAEYIRPGERRLSGDLRHGADRLQQAILNRTGSVEVEADYLCRRDLADLLTLWLLLCGHRRSVLEISTDTAAAQCALGRIRSELNTNDRLLADFPDTLFPIHFVGGIPQRRPVLNGRPIKMEISRRARWIQLPDTSSTAAGSIYHPFAACKVRTVTPAAPPDLIIETGTTRPGTVATLFPGVDRVTFSEPGGSKERP